MQAMEPGKIVYLNYENLTCLPTSVLEDKSICVLHLKRNLFEKLPPSISMMRNLTELNLDSNYITHLPTELRHLIHLRSLNLQRNNLSGVEDVLFRLPRLSTLNLFQNNISGLDVGTGGFQALQQIVLANNKLQTFPIGLCYCINLKSLQLSSNDLRILPKEVILLQNLTELSISDNKLKLIPFQLSRLKRLSSLDLYNNEIVLLPTDVFKLSGDDVCLKDSVSQTEYAEEYLIDLARKEYVLRFLTASNTVTTLKELACNVVRTQNVDKKALPAELRYVLSSPVACCAVCDGDIFTTAYYKRVSNDWLIHKFERREDANMFRVCPCFAVFCSYRCSLKFLSSLD